MTKEKYERKEHVVVDEVLVEQRMFCDVCGKEIKYRQHYWEVNIGHIGYGEYDNYSFDVCSVECLKEKFNEYCELSSRDKGYEIDVECRMCKCKGEM